MCIRDRYQRRVHGTIGTLGSRSQFEIEILHYSPNESKYKNVSLTIKDQQMFPSENSIMEIRLFDKGFTHKCAWIKFVDNQINALTHDLLITKAAFNSYSPCPPACQTCQNSTVCTTCPPYTTGPKGSGASKLSLIHI
eukprot:TRINITY_DN32515_c0_g1_i1.p1 TRINITY_DN32515_c0_g1~~TRINITY_DN32515_c0_g1_i1.p1  ORF type:complete len:158 (+),score=39.46 TRINITY_DN32515_c0_g1_i1:61-474(+)